MNEIGKKELAGITDEPTIGDYLNRKKYTSALAKFVQITDTPMTISITGEWGIGKTSFVHQVKNKLNESEGKIKFIEFNTWEISQFEQNDQLKISLLQNFVSEMLADNPVERKKWNVRLAKLGLKFGMLSLDADIEKDSDKKGLVDEVKGLKCDLKKYFESSDKKYVVFIDDLDRIAPINAIEILEFLKLFLSMKNCVYLVAIDSKVIEQGLENKYGEMSSFYKDKRNYFEKLIQLPFYLPNSLLEEKQLMEYLESLDMKERFRLKKSELRLVCRIINLSVGANPRRIKRIINSCTLLDFIVNRDNMDENEIKSLLVFYIVCFQNHYQIEYDNFEYEMIQNNLSIKEYIEEVSKENTETNEKFPEFIQLLRDDNLGFSSKKFKEIAIASKAIDENEPSLTSRVREQIPIIFEENKDLGESLSRGFIYDELKKEFPELEDSQGVFTGLMDRVNHKVGIPVIDKKTNKRLCKDGKKRPVHYKFECVED